jgi:aminopeptidase YwaD
MIEKKDGSGVAGRSLWNVFEDICDCGGRQSGTDGEAKARALLKKLGAEATGVECRSMSVPYLGWRAEQAKLYGSDGSSLLCHPLIRSTATSPSGVEAELVDHGRGTPVELYADAAEIYGRIVIVRHELMFWAGTIKRIL